MNNSSRGVAVPLEIMVESLKACANLTAECRKCHKSFGLGCARDLKLEAAAMLRALARLPEAGDNHD